MSTDPDADVSIDLNDADRVILGHLREGRCTAAFLARRIDWSRAYITQRLRRLEEHDVVANLEGVGLYEFRAGARPVGADTYQ